MTVQVKLSCSWILKGILSQRVREQEMANWEDLCQARKFCINKTYHALLEPQPLVTWRSVFFNNEACPRALFILWLACHNKLAIKERLYKFGMVDNDRCVFCNEVESIQHLLFTCQDMYDIWKNILEWIKVEHNPKGWIQELAWIADRSKSKNWRNIFLKTAFAETVYSCWKYRNKKIHDGIYTTNIAKEVIENIVHRLWIKKKYREHIAHLPMI